jgi:hypothetical protein
MRKDRNKWTASVVKTTYSSEVSRLDGNVRSSELNVIDAQKELDAANKVLAAAKEEEKSKMEKDVDKASLALHQAQVKNRETLNKRSLFFAGQPVKEEKIRKMLSLG